MTSIFARRASVLLLLAWPFAAACGSDTNGANVSACRIDTDVVCPGNFVGYSCQGKSKPSPSCGAGTLESDGETGYCCGVKE